MQIQQHAALQAQQHAHAVFVVAAPTPTQASHWELCWALLRVNESRNRRVHVSLVNCLQICLPAHGHMHGTAAKMIWLNPCGYASTWCCGTAQACLQQCCKDACTAGKCVHVVVSAISAPRESCRTLTGSMVGLMSDMDPLQHCRTVHNTSDRQEVDAITRGILSHTSWATLLSMPAVHQCLLHATGQLHAEWTLQGLCLQCCGHFGCTPWHA